MTLAELEQTLPNGFHDAKIERISIDYVERTVICDMHLLVGLPEESEGDRDGMRRARVTMTDFYYCVIEAPDTRYSFHDPDAIWVSGEVSESRFFAAMESLSKQIPKNGVPYSFFVHDWNSFIHIAAGSAESTWME